MLTNDTTHRHCARCYKDLTDPASREAGVGPICRGKDNHLYAKLIKANLAQASAIVLGTHENDLPEECRERWGEFRTRFINQFRRSESVTDVRFVGGDFRECVKDIDWLLSHRMRTNIRTRLITVVEELGYVGLAAVLSGDAALSPAKVYIRDNYIFLEGKSCKPGFLTMRKIPGIKCPRFRGDKTPYRVHVSKAEQFLGAVRKHWPMYEGDLDKLLTEAVTIAGTSPEQEVVPTAVIRLRSSDAIVTFPWVQSIQMRELINEIKSIPSPDRKWDPATKAWSVKLSRLEGVKNILSRYYKKVEVTKTDTETPVGTYSRSSAGCAGVRRFNRQRN